MVHVSGDSAVPIALQRRDATVILIGNTLDRTITTSLRIGEGGLDGRYLLRTYNTLRGEWVEQRGFDAERLKAGLPVSVSRRGFCILEFHVEA